MVLATAAAMGRHYVGVELNRQFVRQFESVVKTEVAKEWQAIVAKRQVMQSLDGTFTSLLLRLRVLKYARKVTAAISAQLQKLARNSPSDKVVLQLCVCLADIPNAFEQGDTLDVSLLYLFEGPKERFDRAITRVDKLLRSFPLNHYRINPSIMGFGKKRNLRKALDKCSKLYLYPRVKPRSYESVRSVEEWLRGDVALLQNNVIPLLSNLEVDVSWMADSYGTAPM